MATIEKLAEALQDIEIKILKELNKRSYSIEELAKNTNENIDSIRRAILWLQNKGLIKTDETIIKCAILTKLGKSYVTKGLPERRFLNYLKMGPASAEKIATDLGLNRQEILFSIGYWKTKNAISFEKDVIKLTEIGNSYLSKKTLEELFLEKLNTKNEINIKDLLAEDKQGFENFKKRNLAEESEKKKAILEITNLGKEVVKIVKEDIRIGLLTPEIIKSGSWKNAKFRRFDIKSAVPKIWPGKSQAYKKFLEEVKEGLVALGFEEVTGSLVETNFWNCDVLYMPQDHPARGIHDIYYIKDPEKTKLKQYEKLVNLVARAHECGIAGSSGWGYKFDREFASKLILRSHGTALSAHVLANNPKIPGAYFSIARCYRPDIVDATHLPEFNQCEGLLLGKNLNLRHLLGLLREFSQKIIGIEKIRFRPSYFPFTEPSLEADIWWNGRWIEVLGAGIFRPEITEIFNIKSPVLAWGIGIDRLFMIRNNITDIRQLFSNDIQWLREAKV
ncbi:MAG: phenylalanine--tRNA ligase subunit alpha [Candidatus Nanoarchaeia archaeon]